VIVPETPPHRPILDSESELSDIEIHPSSAKRSLPQQISDSELSSLSDVTTTPPKKRAKRNDQNKGKRIEPRKGGGKAREGHSDDDSSEEEYSSSDEGTDKMKGNKRMRGRTGKKEKKLLVAKEVCWKDIPDWQGSTDCPLLQLPVEILDRIFAPESNLAVSSCLVLIIYTSAHRIAVT
jgi:hypothetical protein